MTFILHQKAAESFRRARDEFRALPETDDARGEIAASVLALLRQADPNMSIFDVLEILEGAYD
jgi:hypothetical protein